MVGNKKIDISVIVITTNRLENFSRMIESLMKQKTEDVLFEVIVVVNGNKDYWKEVKKELEKVKKAIKTILVYDSEPSLHTARHAGIRASRADLLAFCDDDIEVPGNWIKKIVDTFYSNPSVVIVGGKILPSFEIKPPKWLKEMWIYPRDNNLKCLEHLSIFDGGNKKREINPGYVFGCAFFIRKWVLGRTKGFHPDSLPKQLIRYRGDGETYVTDYIRENKMGSLYCPDIVTYHQIPTERMTVDYFYRRSFSSGVSDSYSLVRRTTKIKRCFLVIGRWRSLILSVKLLINKYLREDEAIRVKLMMTKGYVEGYLFHQLECLRDNNLIQWVVKENYYNVDKPVNRVRI